MCAEFVEDGHCYFYNCERCHGPEEMAARERAWVARQEAKKRCAGPWRGGAWGRLLSRPQLFLLLSVCSCVHLCVPVCFAVCVVCRYPVV